MSQESFDLIMSGIMINAALSVIMFTRFHKNIHGFSKGVGWFEMILPSLHVSSYQKVSGGHCSEHFIVNGFSSGDDSSEYSSNCINWKEKKSLNSKTTGRLCWNGTCLIAFSRKLSAFIHCQKVWKEWSPCLKSITYNKEENVKWSAS